MILSTTSVDLKTTVSQTFLNLVLLFKKGKLPKKKEGVLLANTTVTLVYNNKKRVFMHKIDKKGTLL